MIRAPRLLSGDNVSLPGNLFSAAFTDAHRHVCQHGDVGLRACVALRPGLWTSAAEAAVGCFLHIAAPRALAKTAERRPVHREVKLH